MLYQLNLILNSNQGLALFRQKYILTFNRHKNSKKKKDLFIQLFNSWLHFTNNNFPIPTSIEEILAQPIFKTHTPSWTLALITRISIASDSGIFQTNLP